MKGLRHIQDDPAYRAESEKLDRLEAERAELDRQYRAIFNGPGASKAIADNSAQREAEMLLSRLDDKGSVQTAVAAAKADANDDRGLAGILRAKGVIEKAIGLQRRRAEDARRKAAEEVCRTRRAEYVAALQRIVDLGKQLVAAHDAEGALYDDLRAGTEGLSSEILPGGAMSHAFWSTKENPSGWKSYLERVKTQYPEIKV